MATSGWTLLIYVAADDPRLHEDFQANLRDMAAAGSTDDLRVLAQVDWSDHGERRELRGHRWRVEAMDTAYEASKGTVFRSFLEWGVSRALPGRVAVILIGHGNGVGFRLVKPRKIQPIEFADPWKPHLWIADCCFHEEDGLTTREMATELARAFAGRHLDLLGFNACYMNALEIAYELRTSVACVTGSQSGIPWKGWDFRALLSAIGLDPSLGVRELTDVIVDSYMRRHKGVEATTLSVLDLTRAPDVLTPMRDLVAALDNALPERRAALAASFLNTRFTEVAEFLDVGDMCTAVSHAGIPAVAEAATRLHGAVHSLVRRHEASIDLGGRTSGVSLFFLPMLAPDAKLSARVRVGPYANLDLPSQTGWSDFMTRFGPINAAD